MHCYGKGRRSGGAVAKARQARLSTTLQLGKCCAFRFGVASDAARQLAGQEAGGALLRWRGQSTSDHDQGTSSGRKHSKCRQQANSAARHATGQMQGQTWTADPDAGRRVRGDRRTRAYMARHGDKQTGKGQGGGGGGLPDRDLGDVLGRLTGDPDAETAAESERSLCGPRWCQLANF